MNAPLQSSPPAPIAALFSEHGDFVFRTLQYLGVPGPSLDDGLQDVFVTAHRRWEVFEGRSTPRTWLYGIARRVAFRYRRKDENHRRRFVLTERLVEGAETPFDQAHARRSVQALLEALDENKRASFVMVEVEGFTAAEAAELLEIPLGTVYSRVRAAWARLREAAQLDDVQVASMQVQMPAERRLGLERAVMAACLPSAGVAVAATATTGLGGLGWVWAVAALGIVGVGVGVATVLKPPSSGPANVSVVDAAARREAIDTQPQPQPQTQPSQAQPQPSQARAAEPTALPLESPAPEPAQRGVPEAKPRVQLTPAKPAAEGPEVKRPASTLLEELPLIRKAQEFIRDGKPDRARELLDEHARRFADGLLADERREVQQSWAAQASGTQAP